jgi:hypothetical protein
MKSPSRHERLPKLLASPDRFPYLAGGFGEHELLSKTMFPDVFPVNFLQLMVCPPIAPAEVD